MVDNSVILAKASQSGIPISLAEKALENGIDLDTILNDFNKEEKPYKWSPNKVRIVQDRISKMVSEKILVNKADIDKVNIVFMYQMVLLIEESGINYTKDENYKIILKEAQKYYSYGGP